MSITSPTRTIAENPRPYVVNTPESTSKSTSGGTVTPSPQDSTGQVDQPLGPNIPQLLADQQNLRNLAAQLRGITPWADEKIATWLNKTRLTLDPGSTDALAGATPTIASALQDLAFELPGTVDEINALVAELENSASVHPLGNFGGGFSWPVPISEEDKSKIHRFMFDSQTGVSGLPLTDSNKGVLGYLLNGSSVTPDELKDPVKALQKLLDTPRAKALGLALEKHLGGVPTDTSLYDYVLTAIHATMDVWSLKGNAHNRLTDFDLGPEQWGQSPATVVERLSAHLIEKGRATPDTVKLVAHLLLSRLAPQFLIKDIPDSVKIGSAAWVTLSVAAAAIEARSPGTVATMTFSQVMLAADSACKEEPSITQQAQKIALIDWGVIHNVITQKAQGNYSDDEIEKVRAEFNQRQTQRIEGASEIDAEFLVREKIARNYIRETFGEDVPLEEKLFKVKGSTKTLHAPLFDPNREPAGSFSLLDIIQSGLHNFEWETNDPRLLEAIKGKSLKFDVNEQFNKQLNQTIETRQQGVDKLIKCLISELPLVDRQNFEYGKLKFYQDKTYEIPSLLWSNRLVDTSKTLMVETNGANGKQVYEIDLKAGRIIRVPDKVLTRQRERVANTVFKIEEFKSANSSRADFGQNKDVGVPLPIPSSFSSARTQAIADLFIEHLDFKNPDVIKELKGTTNFDKQMENDWKITDFFLNFFPLRSAIQSFSKGDYLEGAIDLTLDAFSLLTMGASTAAKLFKTGVKAATALSKGARALRIVAAGLISAFNPLGGVDDLLKGIGNLGKYVVSKSVKGVNMLKGANGSHKLLKETSKHYGVVATGTIKHGEQAFEGSAVLWNGKWHAYDPMTARPYGPPLTTFDAKTVAMGGEIQTYKTVTMGGDTQSYKTAGGGLGAYTDVTKRGTTRLTLDAHGIIPDGHGSALMLVNGEYKTPGELYDLLLANNLNPSKFDEIRLTMCHSANGGAQSFAAQFARLTKKRVDGFEGIMQVTKPEAEDMTARVFANKARERDYIDQHIIGKKHTIVKYRQTARTPDNYAVYTHSPNYNPVNFDAQGNMIKPKPLRADKIGEKLEPIKTDEGVTAVDVSRHENADLEDIDLT